MQDITNWQPISSPNRLQNSLTDIISTEKTTAIKGRTIIENLQLNRDIISFANINELKQA